MYTHELTFTGPIVTKRYRSWGRGEHRREWAALGRIHRHAQNLAPRPVAADLHGEPPVITMSRLPGDPLAGHLTDPQVAALESALKTLWTVPCGGLAALGPWRDDLDFAARLTDGPRPTGDVTAAAYDAALAWWDGPDPQLLRHQPETTVLGHRDPNLSNYLWDGDRVRIVDFEDAALCDPATELALLAEHLSTRDTDVDALLGRFRVDQRRLRAARRLWAMFWLRLLLPGGPAAGRNPPDTAGTQARRLLDLLRD